MTRAVWTAAVYGDPRQKKNNGRIIRIGGKPRLIPSKAYVEYENGVMPQLLKKRPQTPIGRKVNVRCMYYMKTRRRVDLVNLQEATLDILVKAGILEDDNFRIVAGMDGSRVLYDKDEPRVEIYITEVE